eukprot:PhM_4_TR2824/c0_g1_i1/m.266
MTVFVVALLNLNINHLLPAQGIFADLRLRLRIGDKGDEVLQRLPFDRRVNIRRQCICERGLGRVLAAHRDVQRAVNAVVLIRRELLQYLAIHNDNGTTCLQTRPEGLHDVRMQACLIRRWGPLRKRRGVGPRPHVERRGLQRNVFEHNVHSQDFAVRGRLLLREDVPRVVLWEERHAGEGLDLGLLRGAEETVEQRTHTPQRGLRKIECCIVVLGNVDALVVVPLVWVLNSLSPYMQRRVLAHARTGERGEHRDAKFVHFVCNFIAVSVGEHFRALAFGVKVLITENGHLGRTWRGLLGHLLGAAFNIR